MKKVLKIAAVIAGLIVTVGLIRAAQSPKPEGESESRAEMGLKLSPVPLNLKGKNRKLVGIGSYIVNAQSGCVDCHSSPTFMDGGNPFFGQPEQLNTKQYLAGGRFYGPFYASNLTPDDQGKPAGLSLEEFLSEMRGQDIRKRHPQFGPFLQVMPWPIFRKMAERDLRAIYEYLSAIPHADPGLPSSICDEFKQFCNR